MAKYLSKDDHYPFKGDPSKSFKEGEKAWLVDPFSEIIEVTVSTDELGTGYYEGYADVWSHVPILPYKDLNGFEWTRCWRDKLFHTELEAINYLNEIKALKNEKS